MTEDLIDDIEATTAGVDPVIWVVLGAVVVLAVLIVVAALSVRRRRTGRYEQRFGREYDRTVDRIGSTGDAEDELDARAERHQRFALRSLSPAARESLRARWDELQAGFVDVPASTVRNAEVLLDEAARDRGYPDADPEQRLDDLALDHSDEVHAYRQACGDLDGDDADRGSSLRRQMVAGRALLDAILEAGRGEPSEASTPSRRDEAPAPAGPGPRRSEQGPAHGA